MFWQRKMKEVGNGMQGKEKNLDEIVLQAFVFRYSRPEFPCFENYCCNVLSRVTNCSAEIVGHSCCLRRGNDTKTDVSVLL